MKYIPKPILRLILILMCLLPGYLLLAEPSHDWPQYRGVNRDGISDETALIQTWPTEGPKLLWKAVVGDGFSGISISNGRLYTMFSQGDDELVACFDASSGKEIWRYKLDSNYVNDQGNGPRGTPTVDGDMVYVLGAQAMLAALKSGDGTKVWEHNLQKELGAKVPIWGVSSSPLIENDTLLVPVGGSIRYAELSSQKIMSTSNLCAGSLFQICGLF